MLGCAQNRRSAIGNRARNDQRIGSGEAQRLARSAGHRGSVLLVQHIQRIGGSAQCVIAPIFFRVDLRVRLLECHPVRKRGVKCSAGRIGDVGRKVGQRARHRAGGTGSVNAVHGVVAQVVQAHAFAGIGQRHRTTALEAPITSGTNGSIDPTGTGRWAHHDAGCIDIKTVRNLHGHGHTLASTAVVEYAHILQPWHQALAQRVLANEINVGSVESAVATVGSVVDQPPVVGLDSVAAQLVGRRIGRVGKGRERGQRGAGDTALAQAGGQQVLTRGRIGSTGCSGPVGLGAQIGHTAGQSVHFRLHSAASTTPGDRRCA